MSKSSSTVTEAGTAAELVSAHMVAATAERPIQRTHPAGRPFVVLVDRDGAQRIECVDIYEPPRKEAALSFFEAQSFIEYVNLYADPASRLFCESEKRRFEAVLDYHDKSSGDALGRRGRHRAVFEMRLTPAMKAWLELTAQPVPQADFAEFLEDHYFEIAEPDGAFILDLAKGLQVRSNTALKSVQRASDGGYDLNYQEEVSTGPVSVPARLLLALQVFEGGPVLELPVRLRFKALGSGVAFRLVFLELDRLIRDEVRRVRDEIAEKTTRAVWAGTVVSMG